MSHQQALPPFVPLDCNKPAFRHLRVCSPVYESMLPINQAVTPPERFDVPKKAPKGERK